MSQATAVLARFVDAVDREGLGAYGVHVLVGNDHAEHRWRSDDRENLYSVSKGVCVLAIGIAIDEGLISLETGVAEALPHFTLGAGAESVTLRHLLTMSSGIDFEWFADSPVTSPDLAQQMLERPTQGAGTVFQYSDASTYVAMRMLASAVGDVVAWLRPRLFDPLNIHNPQWQRCPQGFIFGGSGLELRTEELARIGRVLRDRGLWRSTRIVSADWVDAMHTDWVRTGGDAPFAHYSLAVWEGPGECWRLDGRYGQYVVIDQQQDAVITITAHEEHRDHLLAEFAARALRQ
ncbi:CubicO group peptidase (beta-lactamase class C family) [Microbacterium endophyticum]|uniref:CubicO group peptidase (Beta-lactamase class C family) n=1 Tax=Microbacterium endophyticum TaxID=1526412 RepID=A0A7W4V4B1_9MICO|nr:serine hydrolase [Microbacterium endophyticum]MBB2975933.1 CubicO group peptidase (beta-lactamase class C family) [Microbacterium endophyticum]NIK37698.1 CubicO group peptidase (beta-lactamase class C family) [Microbacterium endophyticum]